MLAYSRVGRIHKCHVALFLYISWGMVVCVLSFNLVFTCTVVPALRGHPLGRSKSGHKRQVASQWRYNNMGKIAIGTSEMWP